MDNDLENKSGPQKNVQPQTPSPSEQSGPRITNADAAMAKKLEKATPDERRELERMRRMGVAPSDDVTTRGANIKAQGVHAEEPILLPRHKDNDVSYEPGEYVVNDYGDTVPALKLKAPTAKVVPETLRPLEPNPAPFIKR